MNETLQLTHPRIGDLPLLPGLLITLGMPEIYDREIRDHGLHTGLSGGWMLTLWRVFILTESDHTKSSGAPRELDRGASRTRLAQ